MKFEWDPTDWFFHVKDTPWLEQCKAKSKGTEKERQQ
jgi:hypothetical protein